MNQNLPSWVALTALLLLSGMTTCPRSAFAEEKPGAEGHVDFVQQVLPILRDNCFSCHGPDKQKSGYRLDSKLVAVAGGDFGEAAIVPGKPSESPLLRYVAGDGDIVMPPEGAKLTTEQVATLQAWIGQGAAWPDDASVKLDNRKEHWAFQPLGKAPVPQVDHPQLPIRNAVDAFVLQTLTNHKLQPSPPADRRTLCRRVYLDALGLPPTFEQVQAFVNDSDPLAHEKLVEQLLASPHFGERVARNWLDVVRFAESHGFEMNQPRPNAWHYRDYVIAAFNSDKPYDQFVREQLAGDAHQADSATGFLVAGAWDQVKSPDPVLTAQQRADELHDIVSTTSSTFLGLTVGCARCHNHKFDPISQVDYYAIKACFAGVQHGERALPAADNAERLAKLQQLQIELAKLDSAIASMEPLDSGRRIVLIDDSSPNTQELVASRPAADNPPGVARGEASDPGDRLRMPNLGKAYKWWEGEKSADLFAWEPKLTGRWQIWLSWGCGWDTHAHEVTYLLDADGNPATRNDQTELLKVDHRMFADGTGEPLPNKPLWSGLRDVGAHELTPTSRILLRSDASGKPVTADLIVFEDRAATAERSDAVVNKSAANLPQLRRSIVSGENVDRFIPVDAKFVRFTVNATNGDEPCLDELEIFAADGDRRNVALAALNARTTASGSFPGAEIHKLEHLNDGKYGNSHSWISNERGRGWVQVELPTVERIDRVVWSRDRGVPAIYTDRTAKDYQIEVSHDGNAWKTVATSANRLPVGWLKTPATFAQHLTDQEAGALKDLQSRRGAIVASMAALTAQPMVYAGRFTNPEATMRLHRGDATQPKEPVPPAGLSEIGQPLAMPADASDQQRRAALGRWIIEQNGALAARVIVNRIFQQHFGRGIVDTPSDFGLSGARPTHPELLDWLAAELIQPSDVKAAPWSLKHIHRLLLLSSTYRQSSQATAEGLKQDAGSTLLWRYPPRRLEAETIRDTVLAVSGQLDRSVGGPGFDLFEPNGNYVKVYTPKQSFGRDTFRRMIYQTKPRMQLDDTFGAFDCPDAGQIAPKRGSSITPLQALNLLNSPFMLAQAGYFSKRIQSDAGSAPQKQAERAFELAFNRQPTDEERDEATQLVTDHGLVVLCRAILNANEFVVIE
jgi:mono/diheme cytochrome c family protein